MREEEVLKYRKSIVFAIVTVLVTMAFVFFWCYLYFRSASENTYLVKDNFEASFEYKKSFLAKGNGFDVTYENPNTSKKEHVFVRENKVEYDVPDDAIPWINVDDSSLELHLPNKMLKESIKSIQVYNHEINYVYQNDN